MTSLICAECGQSWTYVRFRPAPTIHTAEGPSVPTPEDILNGAAGLLL